MKATLITSRLALDGYGPAANVTGDGAVALALDRFFGNEKDAKDEAIERERLC